MKSHLYSIILIFILFKAEAKKEEYSVQSLTPVMVSNRLGLPNISFDTKTYTASGNPISSPVPFLLKNRGILFNLFTAPSLVASQMPNKNYDVILKISANFKDNSGNLQTKEFELKINYNTNGEIKYKAKDEYYINGIGWCNFTIISQIIKDESGNLITASEANNWFTFKSQLQVERFYKPNPNSTVTPYPNFFPVTTPFPSSPRVESPIPKSVIFRKSGNNGYITVLWNPVYWAEYYELEYCLIDNYGENLTKKTLNELNVNFKFNSTRIQTSNSSFEIPNIFESGYLVCRVRPVGFIGENFEQPIPGKWSLNDEIIFKDFLISYNNFNRNFDIETKLSFSTFLNYTYEINAANTHELDKKNWQLINSFTEDAKTKSVITYLDGTLRSRQSQTNLSTNNTVVVGETIYDYQGRPAIDFLPVPIYGIASETPAIKYQNKFNINSFGNTYNKDDFDKDSPPNCEISPSIAPSTSGSSKYYSSQNLRTAGLQALVPDAEGFPFTQREYTPDMTGRIKRVGSPGIDHHLGSNNDKHEIKYEYASPTQSELDRLFGNDAGFSVFYTKEMVIDGNGQATISIKDNKDKVVATALGGKTPNNLDSLNSQIASPTIINLAGATFNRYNEIENTLKSERDFIITVPTTLTLNYNIDDAQLDIATCTNQPNVCYNCNYDLKVSIVENSCGTIIENISQNIGSLDNVLNCSVNNTTSFNRTYQLQAGTYTISKTLIVNQASIDSVVNTYLSNICIENKTRYIFDEEKKDDADACQPTCKVCETNTTTNSIVINGRTETVTVIEPKLDGTCSTVCDPQKQFIENTCLLAYERMINDLTPPNGQYAKTGSTDSLSYFSTNQLGRFWIDIVSDWGLTSTITDSVTFSHYLQANKAEVQKLLPYHPEFCYYQFCTSHENLIKYQADLSTKPLSTALLTANYGSSLQNGDFLDDLFSKDPLILILSPTQVSGFKEDLTHVLKALADPTCPPVSPADDYNIIQVAKINASGLKNPSKVVIDAYLNSHPNFLQSGAAQEEWSQYKNLYIQIRQKYFEIKRDEIITSWGGSCTDAVAKHNKIANPSERIWKDKIPVFPNKKQIKDVITNGLIENDFAPSISNCSIIATNPTTTPSNCNGNCATSDYLLALLNRVNRSGNITINRNLSGSILNILNFDESWNNSFVANEDIKYTTNWQTNKLIIDISSRTKSCKIELKSSFTNPDFLKNIYSFYCINDTTITNLPLGVSSENVFVIRAILLDGRTIILTGYSTCFRISGCLPNIKKPKGKCNDDALIAEAIKMTNDMVFKRNNLFYNQSTGLNQIPTFSSKLSEHIKIYANESRVGAALYFSFYNKKNTLDSLLFMYASIKYDDFKVGIKSYDGYEIGYEKDTCTSISLTLTYTTVQNVKVKVLLRLEKKTNLYFVECCKNIDDFKFCCIPPTIVPPGTFDPPLKCEDIVDATNKWNVDIIMDQYIHYLSDSIRTVYTKSCLQKAQATEALRINYTDLLHHFTLYYYDQAGNLITTVPPKGVIPLNETQTEQVANFRNTGSGLPLYPVNTNHTFKSEYTFNSLNAVLQTTNPDGGLTKFCYDELGRVIMSKDAVQSSINRVSFSFYDELGRVTRSGTMKRSGNLPSKLSYGLFKGYLNLNTTINSFEEITENIYNRVNLSVTDFPLSAQFTGSKQQNAYNRIAATLYYKKYINNGIKVYDHAFYYSYDSHGNVKELLQDSRFLTAKINWLGTDDLLFHRIKMMQYGFDLVSGKVNEMIYQPNKADQFIHRYTYDADNRITKVQTFTKPWEDEALKDVDVSYYYYDHEPLARVVLGHEQVQGLDHYYNILGWQKGVNSPSLNPNNDPSRDGTRLSKVCGDVMSFALGYYLNDYKPIGLPATVGSILPTENGSIGNSLYNGNIRNMYTSIGSNNNAFAPLQLRAFRYDAINRLVNATVHDTPNLSNVTPSPIDAYKEIFSYDANGNILTVTRNNATGGSLDVLTYNYSANNNKLNSVIDGVGRTDLVLKDLDANSNFNYDLKGRLKVNEETGSGRIDKINNILWSSTDKVWEIQKADGLILKYEYNALAQRVFKDNSQTNNASYNVRDLQGNTIATYDIDKTNSQIQWAEAHIYGSSRVGMWRPKTDINAINDLGQPLTTGIIAYTNSFLRGEKQYELSNHLGNVLATINDRKIKFITTANDTLLKPYILSSSDYYAFGFKMPNRINNEYQYGFIGNENDTGINKSMQDFGLRIYEPRLGIFLSIDPLSAKFAWNSPYSYAENSPIVGNDVDGSQFKKYYDKLKKSASQSMDKEVSEEIVVFSRGLYPEVEGATEATKQFQFLTNPRNSLAILLYEFATGTGKNNRTFSYGQPDSFANSFLQGRVLDDIQNELSKRLKDVTADEFQKSGIVFALTFSPDHAGVWESVKRHATSNFSQFVIGGANVSVLPTNDVNWVDVSIVNPMSRNSLLLHQADSYSRNGGVEVPLSTTTQTFIFRMRIDSSTFKQDETDKKK